jgi:polysaccharide biosynthesis transport protein
MNDPTLASTHSNIKPNDIIYAFFKHKVKIVLFAVLGVVAAGAVYVLYPRSYSSQARLFIRYVEQGKTPMQTSESDRITTLETRSDSIINSELQIISSMDLAMKVAEKIGPERILGDPNKAHNIAEAAKEIRDDLAVGIPARSTVIKVDYSHSNPNLVQPILQELIDAYLAKHLETRSAGSFDNFVNQQAEQYRSRLARTEEEFHNALGRAGVISLEEAKADQNSKIASIQGALLDSKAELASRQAMLDEMRKITSSGTASTEDSEKIAPVPTVDPNALQSYASIQARLDVLRRSEQDLLTRYTLENILVKGVQTQIADAEEKKAALENENPLLAQAERIAGGGTRIGPSRPAFDLNTSIIQVTALKSKIAVLEAQFAQIQKDAIRIASVETEIQELRRRKEIEEQNYRYFSESREQAKIDEAFGAGRVNNIGIVQSPTPPEVNKEKLMKIAGGVLAAALAFGLAWALLMEFYLDQSIKRPIDIKRSLNIPLFLSIPDTTSRAYRKLLKKTGKQNVLDREKRAKSKPSKDSYQPKSPTLVAAAKSDPDRFGAGAVANMEDFSEASPWDDDHALNSYYEALRDRLIGFFEGRGMTHKPKLIGLTGIGDTPGTTTIASGLAGTLSQTGEGNVLLVDMTLGSESAQQFYQGKNITDLDQLLGGGPVTNKKNEGKLVVAAEGTNGFKLPKILPNRFNELVPKLKSSEFDYIIFDMPAVSPISVTPRLASFMDAVFLVIESEKASKEVVKRATELLQKTNDNIGAILNKTKSYVPQRLQEEYLGDL